MIINATVVLLTWRDLHFALLGVERVAVELHHAGELEAQPEKKKNKYHPSIFDPLPMNFPPRAQYARCYTRGFLQKNIAKEKWWGIPLNIDFLRGPNTEWGKESWAQLSPKIPFGRKRKKNRFSWQYDAVRWKTDAGDHFFARPDPDSPPFSSCPFSSRKRQKRRGFFLSAPLICPAECVCFADNPFYLFFPSSSCPDILSAPPAKRRKKGERRGTNLPLLPRLWRHPGRSVDQSTRFDPPRLKSALLPSGKKRQSRMVFEPTSSS